MPQTYAKNSHCSYCGAVFSPNQPWPRRCGQCRHVTYSNPLPVAVVLLPVGDGLLYVRRTQEPSAGELSLPGGFIETGESWQEAGARELREETGTVIDPESIALFDTRSAPDGTLLVFGLAPPQLSRDLPPFRASNETSEAVIVRGPLTLAFSTHTETVARYWKEILENGKADTR